MERLGNYRIIRRLGAGAMGEVYLGEHTLLLCQRAIKVLPEALSQSASFRERFVNEGRVLATLQHPCIVQIYDMAEEEGRFYIAMEFVSPNGTHSCTLEDLLMHKGGRLVSEDARKALDHVCRAIAYAHSKGIIHRDIKPGNILFSAEGRMKVSDFGLAQIVGSDFIQQSIAASISGSLGTDQSIVPSPGVIGMDNALGAKNNPLVQGSSRAQSLVGTYNYMPPEVQEGGEWTKQGDIYSLGVLAYVLLVGQRPVGNWKTPSTLIPGTSVVWDTLVERALDIDPKDRYSKVKDFLDALKHTASSVQPIVLSDNVKQEHEEPPHKIEPEWCIGLEAKKLADEEAKHHGTDKLVLEEQNALQNEQAQEVRHPFVRFGAMNKWAWMLILALLFILSGVLYKVGSS